MKIKTRMFALAELDNSGALPAATPGDWARTTSLPLTRATPAATRVIEPQPLRREAQPMAVPNLEARTRSPRLAETLLVPKEELLARHGISSPVTARRELKSSAIPARVQSARKKLAAKLATSTRHRVIAAIVGLVLVATVVSRGLAGNVLDAAVQPTARSSPPHSPGSPRSQSPQSPQSLQSPQGPTAHRAREPIPPSPEQSALALHVTLDRAASDAVIEGRYGAAAELYERLARAQPSRPVYREAARILRDESTDRGSR